MTIDDLRNNAYDALRTRLVDKNIKGAMALDFILNDHKYYRFDDDCFEDLEPMEELFSDDKKMWQGIDNLCRLKSVLSYREVIPDWLEDAANSCSWSSLATDLRISNYEIGEIRQLLKDNRCSITGLMADVGLSKDDIATFDVSTAAMLFLARMRDYQASENHNDENLWYLTYNGRIGKCSYIGEKRWGMTHLNSGTIGWDRGLCVFVATREINGEGCSFVRHRPIINRIGSNWQAGWISKIEEYFDGGVDCTMTIDRDFKTAYEPIYDDNDSVLDYDCVCGYSCMSGRGDDAQKFYGAIEGCSVVRFEDADGNQVGRCLVYEYDGHRHFMRLYAKREYQNKANIMIKAMMKDGDVRGREDYIADLRLRVDWDNDTKNMYLDGPYGISIDNDKLYLQLNYDYMFHSTSDDYTCFEKMGVNRCSQCGRLHRCFKVFGQYFCCAQCARDAGLVKCKYCGDWFNPLYGDHVQIDGNWYCCDSCARSDGYRQCKHCGKWSYNDSMIHSLQQDFYCNDECALADGCKIDEITGYYTDDWVRVGNTNKYVDALRVVSMRNKYTIRVCYKHKTKKDLENETNID